MNRRFTTGECRNDGEYGRSNICKHVSETDDAICDKNKCVYSPDRGYSDADVGLGE